MIICGLLLMGLSRQQVPLLMEKATLLADVKDWAGITYQVADYHWLDSNVILYSVENRDQTRRFRTLNLLSKQESASGLTSTFLESHGELSSLEVSPNGKKVLWAGWKDKQSRWFIADSDGRNATSFERKKVSMVLSNHGPDDETTLSWGPDSKTVYESMIEFGDGTSTLLWSRSIDPLDGDRTLPTAKGYVDWQPNIIKLNMAFTSSGLAIGGERKSAGFVTWMLSDPKRTRKEWVVTAPRNRTISVFKHSHDGSRILWDLSVHDPKISDTWDLIGEEIWLSDAVGKNWKLVARMPFDTKTKDIQFSQFGSPIWTLDDNAFSFAYMHKLYKFELNSSVMSSS